MAGRFLFRKLSSRMSRSTGLLGANSPASAAAGGPLTTVETRSLAARYINTLPSTRAPSEAGSRAFVNSAGVMRRSFSSSTSTNDAIARKAEWDAKLAANKAEVADWFAKKKAEDDALIRHLAILLGSWCLILWGFSLC